MLTQQFVLNLYLYFYPTLLKHTKNLSKKKKNCFLKIINYIKKLLYFTYSANIEKYSVRLQEETILKLSLNKNYRFTTDQCWAPCGRSGLSGSSCFLPPSWSTDVWAGPRADPGAGCGWTWRSGSSLATGCRCQA